MSQLIAIKPLSQNLSAVYQRRLRLENAPCIERKDAADRKKKRAKIDARRRSRNGSRYQPKQTVARWNDAVRHHTRGRDTGYTAIAMEIPEWIVAEFFIEIEAWKANHTPVRKHLAAVNARILARKRGAK